MNLGSISDAAKHKTDAVALGSWMATWLINNAPLLTAIVTVLTGLWIVFRLIESGQRIYFNWRYGPNAKTGDDE